MQWPRKFPLKPIRKTKARQFGQNKQKQQCSDQTRPDHKNSGLAKTKTRPKIKVGKVAK